MKKLLAIVLSLLMVMSLAVPAMAEDTLSITVNNAFDNVTLNAYQIFKGDITDGKLVNIEWGSGVNINELITALQADSTIGATVTAALADKTTPTEKARAIAEWLSADTTSPDAIKAFSNLVAENKTTTAVDLVKSAGSDETTGLCTYKATLPHAGYYIVIDETTNIADSARSLNMLKVVGAAVVNFKTSKPTIEKKIVEGGGNKVDTNNGAIGDTVNFELTSKVPAEMSHYNKYYFIINDTMSKGLTFNEASVVVKIGETTLTKDTDYTLKTTIDESGNTLIKIVFKNFIQHKDKAGQSIAVTYNATINEQAVIGNTGNPNEVDLTYSNNPNYNYNGEDEPNPGEPTGTTPKDKTKTFVAEFDVQKVDGADNELDGAKFNVQSEQFNKYITTKEVFEESADGEYYKLNNGTYTKEAPNPNTNSYYVSTETKYTLKTDSVVTVDSSTNKESITIGNRSFIGVKEGIYKFTETEAPAGYNKLDEDIYVYVKCILPANADGDATWYYKLLDLNDKANDGVTPMNAADLAALNASDMTTGWITLDNDAATYELKVENKSGSELPETGGIGTTIFYVVGGLMMAVAVVLLVTKKKVNGK